MLHNFLEPFFSFFLLHTHAHAQTDTPTHTPFRLPGASEDGILAMRTCFPPAPPPLENLMGIVVIPSPVVVAVVVVDPFGAADAAAEAPPT